jgi:hypothetical protein
MNNDELRIGQLIHNGSDARLPDLSPPRYLCPVHGTINSVLVSTFPNMSGYWCQLCFLEMLDKQGVSRVVPE